MIHYCFTNPGWTMHDEPDGQVAWAVWTLRGGVSGRADDWDAARLAVADARKHLYPFAADEGDGQRVINDG
jgi:hypothetical protein